MTLKPLVFFGTEDFSSPSLLALLDEGWPIKAVVTKPDTRRGRGQNLKSPAIMKITQQNKITVLQPEKLLYIKDVLMDLKVDYGVLVSYGKIIPHQILDIFSGGIINVHPSLLPKYRGPSPIEAAILNGDEKTGVSLIRLSAGMDEGPIYVQEEVNLNDSEDRIALSENLANVGSKMLIAHLPAIIDGSVGAKPQNDKLASYTSLLKKEDGLIDWADPPQLNERKVRAYRGYPKARAEVFGHNVIILRSKVTNNQNTDSLVVPSGEGFLEILELIAPSGKTMSGEAFSRGYTP